MEVILKIEDLNALYNDIQVLHQIRMEVCSSEIVAIVGSNAAGKSTLLNCIAGLIERTNGNILFRNQRIDKIPAHKIAELGIVLVPEGRRLFPYLSVKDNLLMGAYIKQARPHIPERMEEVFEMLPILKERKDQFAGSLSGGEQQMLAIARALMAGPQLIMMDEPSLGLAPILVDRIFELVESIRTKGFTVLLVEQNVQYSLEISDRAYVLENGRIVLEGEGKVLSRDDRLRKSYMGI